MPVKKTAPAAKRRGVKEPEAKRHEAQPPAPQTDPAVKPGHMRSALSLGLGIVGIMTIAMFLAARGSSVPRAEATVSAASVTADEPAPMKAAPAKPADQPAASGSGVSGAVTLTGCVQRSGDGFRLKDTDGEAAPRARSWKSGFLRKSSASIDLDDRGHANLASFVDKRVSVTGTLIDREMRVSSVHRLAATCE